MALTPEEEKLIRCSARAAVGRVFRGGCSDDDFYQVALIAAWEALRAWEPGLGRSRSSWCQYKARFAVLDHLRDQYRQRGGSPTCEIPETPVLDTPIIHLEDVVRVRKPVSERDWKIIEQRVLDRSDTEIALSMGIESSRVYQLGARLSRRVERV